MLTVRLLFIIFSQDSVHAPFIVCFGKYVQLNLEGSGGARKNSIRDRGNVKGKKVKVIV